jgi:hypothetical protein
VTAGLLLFLTGTYLTSSKEEAHTTTVLFAISLCCLQLPEACVHVYTVIRLQTRIPGHAALEQAPDVGGPVHAFDVTRSIHDLLLPANSSQLSANSAPSDASADYRNKESQTHAAPTTVVQKVGTALYSLRAIVTHVHLS